MAAIWLMAVLPASACEPVDYLAKPLPTLVDDPARLALRLAYPRLIFSADGNALSANDGTTWLPLDGPRAHLSPTQQLAEPTILEQFIYDYPLTFDLKARRAAWNDPGRLRNEAFFQALYFPSKAEARASLETVDLWPLSKRQVQITAKGGVSCQLSAVRDVLAPEADRLARFFAQPGGGFNWRPISGTQRLSPHSYGIAFDIDPALGGYWKWAGVSEGNAENYETGVPADLVRAMERFGFIWGGKWHHYDGMHFEFRPEIIIYSRLKDVK